MAQVMQAMCPGCKALLRLPAEWVNQAVRCTNCGTTLQAKAPPPSSPARPVAPPPPRSASSTPPPPAKSAPASKGIKAPSPVVARSSESSFDFSADDAPRRRRRRGSGGGAWVALILLLGVVGIAGGVGLAFWPKISKALKDGNHPVVRGKDRDPDDDPPPIPGKGGTSRPATTNGAKGKSKDKGKDDTRPTPAGVGDLYPRRAMIISVHNYLYANPIMPGMEGMNAFANLTRALNQGLNISATQTYHISDLAKSNPLPPLKPVIEQCLTSFLASCRKQDRIMVFFVGHTKEIEGEAYLAPLEADFKDASTLIPLKWVFDKLKECPARQKILVLDGNRSNASQGEERPSAGPMDAKFMAALKAPPAGVEVWSACSAEQVSHEFDGAPLGIFLDSLRQALAPEKGAKGAKGEKSAMDGMMQKPDDLLPLERIQKKVAEVMSRDARYKNQTAFVAGTPPANGAEYDKGEAVAAAPKFPKFEGGDQQIVRDLLGEVSLPPVKSNAGSGVDINFTSLPPFSPDAMKKYEDTLPADAKLRTVIRKARVALWAVTTATAPGDLQGDVAAYRVKLRDKDMSIMQDSYIAPGAGSLENQFKTRVFNDSKEMSRIVAVLEDVLDELKEAETEVEAAPPRWQAHYTYILSRFQAQLTYLEEYQFLLGQIRREFPPKEEFHKGWRMAAKEKATDSTGKKLLKAARTGYAELAKKHKGTPWEVLGKREELTALGLEWVAY